MRTHTDYECDICGLKFKGLGLFHIHKKSHFKSLKCDFCGKEFKTSKSLNRHKVRHLGLKPHKCGSWKIELNAQERKIYAGTICA